MAIARASLGAGGGTETSAAALSVNCPATVNANDILIAQVLYLDTSTTPDTPSGWTRLDPGPYNVGTTPVGRMFVFGKIADGTEDGAAVSFGTNGGTAGRAARIYSFSGWVSGRITEVVPSASFSGIPHATDPQGPTVVTTVVGSLAVALTCQDDNNTEEVIAGMSGGTWADFQTFVDANLGAQGLHIDYEGCIPTANPGTVTGGAMVAANDNSCTIGFEIRPFPFVPYVNIFSPRMAPPLTAGMRV